MFGKVLATLLSIASLVSAKNFQVPEPKTQWVTATFDHFNTSDTRTFQEKVLIYDGYLKAGAPSASRPIFIICGGEAGVRGGYNHDGLAFEIAEKYHALVFSPEHRFYGESLPFGPVQSYTPDNLSKLTVQQALEDYKDVLKLMRKQYGLTSGPVISVGGSYPGELASFLRQMKVVDFALASSAPVRYRPYYEPNGTPNGGFFETTTQSFARQNSACPNLVRDAFSMILAADSSASGRAAISQELGLCSTYESFDLLQLWVESAFATLAMENYPYAIDPFPAWPMNGK